MAEHAVAAEIAYPHPPRVPYDSRDYAVIGGATCRRHHLRAGAHFAHLPFLQPLTGRIVILTIAYASRPIAARSMGARSSGAWASDRLRGHRAEDGRRPAGVQTLAVGINRLLDFAFVGSASCSGRSATRSCGPRS